MTVPAQPVKLLTRKLVGELLRIDRAETYDLFPAEEGVAGKIPEGAVLRFLNDNKVACPDELTSLARLETDAEVARSGVVTIDGRPASLRRLRGMCRWKHNPVPHFRIGAHRVRFYPGAVAWWASLIGSGVYVDRRIYHFGAMPVAPKGGVARERGTFSR